MLTTIDNPFNPFDEYESWLRWDSDNGYNTQEYLASVADIQVDDTETTIEAKIDDAIKEILDFDIQGVYVYLKSWKNSVA